MSKLENKKKYTVDVREEGHESELVRIVNKHGFAILNGINGGTVEDVPESFSRVKDWLSNIGKYVDGSTIGEGGEKDGGVFHTHRTDFKVSVDFVAVYCLTQSRKGGSTLLLDGKKLYSALGHTKYGDLRRIALDKFAREGGVGYKLKKRLHFSFEGPQSFLIEEIYGKNPGREVLKLIWANTYKFKLEEGQAYIANDHRVAHGVTRVRKGMRVAHNYDIRRSSGEYKGLKRGFKVYAK